MTKLLTETEEQTLLRDTLRRWFLDGRDAADQARNAVQAPAAGRFDWQALADLGIIGLMVKEDHGGSGCGPAELAVAASEMGRALAHLPYADMVVGGVGILAAADPAQLEDILTGARVVTFADGRCGAIRADGEQRLTGTLTHVRGLSTADILVVAGLDASGRPAVWSLDIRSSDDVLTLEAANACPLLCGMEATSTLERIADLMTLARLADSLGAMDEMLALTVEHLNTRQQFGKPLSAFQALQHRVADMFVETEMARAMVLDLSAACTSEDDPQRRRHAAAAAQLRVSLAADRVGTEAIQLHGGIGMSWEHRVGHLVRRVIATSLLTGGESSALDTLATLPGMMTG